MKYIVGKREAAWWKIQMNSKKMLYCDRRKEIKEKLKEIILSKSGFPSF
jgi:hypothetical protein